MDLDLAKAALESGDPAQRQAIARDLGRQLAARSEAAWLLKFRRMAARLGKRGSSEYERGFLEALELVTTGFERQVGDVAADEAEVLQLRSRARWVAALSWIVQGVVRPIDLAARLAVSPSRVTKLIDELEDAGLITQMAEGKERPCRLTPRARVLLEKLPAGQTSDPIAVGGLGQGARVGLRPR